jgi:hypothetical protein
VVLLDRGHEVQSFWRRNGDKILLLLIGAGIAAIGAGIGTMLTWLFKK